jgi:hypothetical protein
MVGRTRTAVSIFFFGQSQSCGGLSFVHCGMKWCGGLSYALGRVNFECGGLSSAMTTLDGRMN